MSGVILKSANELALMDHANGIIQEILDQIGLMIRPGMTTAEIDRFAEERILAAGATPAFKGYPNPGRGADFPGSVCSSVNSEIVHGIPSPAVILQDGDIVSIDVGVKYQGFFGDSARTFAVGNVDAEAQRLLDITRESLDLGIEQAQVGNRISDIGHAVQKHVEAAGFSVVREFVGHGIGASLHEEPQVPNYGQPGRLGRLLSGMVLAIEPMVNVGSPEVLVSADDGWTARTRDGSRSAHFEFSVAITADGPWVLGRDRRAPIEQSAAVGR